MPDTKARTCAVAAHKVSALNHEILDDSMLGRNIQYFNNGDFFKIMTGEKNEQA